ncbi:MAG: hypothetical protein J4432_04340 [DPANN group archaeon]|nr:hypothetical protein [DPANN group archaeon]
MGILDRFRRKPKNAARPPVPPVRQPPKPPAPAIPYQLKAPKGQQISQARRGMGMRHEAPKAARPITNVGPQQAPLPRAKQLYASPGIQARKPTLPPVARPVTPLDRVAQMRRGFEGMAGQRKVELAREASDVRRAQQLAAKKERERAAVRTALQREQAEIRHAKAAKPKAAAKAIHARTRSHQ